MRTFQEQKTYLQEHLFAKEDLERISTVISLCEKIKVEIVDNRLIITNEPADATDDELQKIWDECWEKLREEGINMAI